LQATVKKLANLNFVSRTLRGTRCAALALSIAVVAVSPAIADEGGVSFWVPGFFGSLAATPQVPGFSFANDVFRPKNRT